MSSSIPCECGGVLYEGPGGHTPGCPAIGGEVARAEQCVTDPVTLILNHSDGQTCQLLLACGHWSRTVSVRSSVFDFPMDDVHCPICDDHRYLDPRLQVELLRELE